MCRFCIALVIKDPNDYLQVTADKLNDIQQKAFSVCKCYSGVSPQWKLTHVAAHL